MRGQLAIGLLLCMWALSTRAGAQDDTILVEFQVTSVSGDSVYIDAGRLAGLRPGDALKINVVGGTERALINAISKSSSRAQLDGALAVGVGDFGEARIPSSRLLPPTDAPPNKADTRKIEWEAATVPWQSDRPLLAAPVAVRTPAARESKLSGRVFTVIDQTWDQERDQRFLLLRQGLDAMMTNPFNKGGELHFDAEAFRRETHLTDSTITDDRGRIDRFSYSIGGTREDPTRVEIGRFLQYEFSELGVLDGVEVGHRTESGAHVGASFGLFPDPRSDFRTGEDSQLAVFYRSPRHGGETGPDLDWGLALQNTWHSGDEDRDLLVGDFNFRPTKKLVFSADSHVDYYGHGDTIKSKGLELTELNLRTRYSFEAPAGVGAYYSKRRFPELKRVEFTSLTPDQIRNNKLTRVGVDAWRVLAEKFRLSTRFGSWRDQDSTGWSSGFRVSARDWFYERGEVALDLYNSEAAFTKSDGARLSANRRFATSLAGIVFDNSRSQQDGFDGTQSELTTQRVRIHWDNSFSDWNLSTYLESRFGDQQDSLVAGLFLQYRF